jgi:two-component system phosphate regulon response regulator OmpR
MSEVLIVDDDAGVRALVTRWLQQEGYTTAEASTAEEALGVVEANGAIGVVICDLVMPGNGGLWLVDQLRQQAPAIALVLGTANDRVSGAVSLREGVVAYVVKPFSRTLLVSGVAAGLRWHQGVRQAEPKSGCSAGPPA